MRRSLPHFSFIAIVLAALLAGGLGRTLHVLSDHGSCGSHCRAPLATIDACADGDACAATLSCCESESVPAPAPKDEDPPAPEKPSDCLTCAVLAVSKATTSTPPVLAGFITPVSFTAPAPAQIIVSRCDSRPSIPRAPPVS